MDRFRQRGPSLLILSVSCLPRPSSVQDQIATDIKARVVSEKCVPSLANVFEQRVFISNHNNGLYLQYPTWFPCQPTQANGTDLTCSGHEPDDSLPGFHPYEACATMHNGWFCKGNGTGGSNVYWTPSSIWDHYMNSVGIG